MQVNRIEWLRDARKTTSYRRMYGLTLLVTGGSFATSSERRAAEELQHLLDVVIELAIAPSNLLQDIRRVFEVLINLVAKTATEARGPKPYGMRIPHTPI